VSAAPAGLPLGRAGLGLAVAIAAVLGTWGALRVREADPAAYQAASLAEAEAGRALPGRVALRGRVLGEAAVRFGPDDRLRFWIPLVSDSWAPGRPVAALVLDPGGAALGGLTFRARALGGRVPPPVREALAARGIALAPGVQVLDAAPPGPESARRGWLAVAGAAALLLAAGALAWRGAREGGGR